MDKIQIVVIFLSTILVLQTISASDSCKKLKHLDYELFGTKTIYEDARKYINKKDDLPKSFDDDTLQDEHEELVRDHCTPMIFYFVGRHSARFPDGEDIDLYNKQLQELKDTIRNQEANQRCPEKFHSILNWVSKMQFKHDNLITDLGGKEERNIAKRFKRIYPEFFTTSSSNVSIGVTTKIRTAQTGVEFLKEVDGLRIANCDLDSLPTNDVDKPGYNIENILQNVCYKSLIEKHSLPFLEFHKDCDKISKKPKIKEPIIERVKKPEVVSDITKRVAKKLGLPKESRSVVNAEVLGSIFNMCKFENAIQDDSVWCPLFEKKDIEALEYIEDVSSYIKSAYGPNANVRQSCPLVKHLVETFQEGTKLSGSNSEKRQSYFYFSHADPMKKLLATFGMFQDDENFSENRIRKFEEELKVPKDREWRSSLISPFSANMAFILYRCEKPGEQVKHKVLATVTERPVKLGGCKDTKCSSARFFDTYNILKDCDLNKICASN